jgi:outer membrane protein OmpA-like peptidoglycan-associated protein
MRTYQRTARRGLPAVLVVLILGTAPLVAQERKRFVELSAGAAYQSFANATDLDGAVGGVGRLGVWLPANFSIELAGSFAKPKTNVTDLLGNTTKVGVNSRTLSASMLYNMLIGTRSSFYLKAGVGSTKYGSDCAGVRTICGSGGSLIGGLGFRAGVTPTVMVRGEGELNRNKSSTRNLTNVGASLGVSLMLGSKPIADNDGDGVQNNRDRCPDTPRGAQVDGRGCPSDEDGDGVPNGIDRCPGTSAGATVDAQGCPKDSDGDNIPDGLDKCPDTPSGVLVDPNGCPKDSDGDGIPDGLDRCSETPHGATVDALGCPGDEDGDGVLDGLDRCPRTPTGAAVQPNGCMAGQAAGQPAPSVSPTPAAPDTAPKRARPGVRNPPRVQQPPPTQSQAPPPGQGQGQPPAQAQAPTPTRKAPAAAAGNIVAGVIPGVGFAPGTARLSQASYVALDSIAEILVADPSATVEVSAHTDNSVSPAEAMRLTGLQADAVRDYLVTRGVPYQQVVSKGYGSTIPRTPDTTPNGRAANRRVEIRVVTPGP